MVAGKQAAPALPDRPFLVQPVGGCEQRLQDGVGQWHGGQFPSSRGPPRRRQAPPSRPHPNQAGQQGGAARVVEGGRVQEGQHGGERRAHGGAQGVVHALLPPGAVDQAAVQNGDQVARQVAIAPHHLQPTVAGAGLAALLVIPRRVPFQRVGQVERSKVRGHGQNRRLPLRLVSGGGARRVPQARQRGSHLELRRMVVGLPQPTGRQGRGRRHGFPRLRSDGEIARDRAHRDQRGLNRRLPGLRFRKREQRVVQAPGQGAGARPFLALAQVLAHPLQPVPALQIGDQRHGRWRDGLHPAASERGGEISLAGPHDEAVALKGVDPARRAERRGGAGEFQPVARGAAVQHGAAFRQELPDLRRRGGTGPQRRPEFRPRVVLILHPDAAPSGAGGLHGEGEAGPGLARAFVPAGQRAGEQQRSLDHQDEVPGVQVGRAFESRRGVRASRRTGSELADGRVGQPVRRIAEQGGTQHRRGLRPVRAAFRVEQPAGRLGRHEAAHEIVGEVQPPVVAAGAQQGREQQVVARQGECRVDPGQRLVRQLPAQAQHEGQLRLPLRAFDEAGVGQRPFACLHRGTQAGEAHRRAVPQRREAVAVVAREEAAAAVPWRHHRARPVVVQEEGQQFLAAQPGA